MTVKLTDDGGIVLEGICTIEDAEALMRSLAVRPGAEVDWSKCEQAHTAVIQILMAARPCIVGLPTDGFLNRRIAPVIREA